MNQIETEEDLLVSEDSWAIMTILQEARGEAFIGKVAVAEVIRNRMRRKYTSDGTVPGTVLWPYQFSGWNTSDPNRIAMAKLHKTEPGVLDAANAWKVSATSNHTNGAVLYYNPKGVARTPKWVHNVKLTAIIGSHRFYNT